ncbi:hypothetical protein BJ170DRAFT_613862 [Xylariales sp. AK1849]|nr:hypothetical protein BJ170DRAFT_613862 [Xylariales sp. AK1849]
MSSSVGFEAFVSAIFHISNRTESGYMIWDRVLPTGRSVSTFMDARERREWNLTLSSECPKSPTLRTCFTVWPPIIRPPNGRASSHPASSGIAASRRIHLDGHTLYFERVHGTSLDPAWKNATHSQRVVIAKQLGEFCKGFLSARHTEAGRICADIHTDSVPPEIGLPDAVSGFVDPFGSSQSHAEVLGETLRRWPRSKGNSLRRVCCELLRRPEAKASYEAISNAIDWRKLQAETRAPELLYDSSAYMWCANVVKAMGMMGLFYEPPGSISPFSLCHFDLFPRNIMVTFGEDGATTLTGIVDWDFALYGPGFVTCAPPAYLWRGSCYYNGSRCNCCSEAEVEPLSPSMNEPVGLEGQRSRKHLITPRALTGSVWRMNLRSLLFGRYSSSS